MLLHIRYRDGIIDAAHERKRSVETSRHAYVSLDQVAAVTNRLREGEPANVIHTRDDHYRASQRVSSCRVPTASATCSIRPGHRGARKRSSPASRAAAHDERNHQDGKHAQRLTGFKFVRLNDGIVAPPMARQHRLDTFRRNARHRTPGRLCQASAGFIGPIAMTARFRPHGWIT
jgi:hypothetical protein